jgi:hypothetical protein
MSLSIVPVWCMQTPTLVYAYSNFLTWHPDLIGPTKKFFLTHHSRLERERR